MSETPSRKERPILFSAPMVRALLDGSKSQTRRIVKVQPHIDAMGNFCVGNSCYGQDGAGRPVTKAFAEWHCPYGQPGDRLWVRENFRFLDSFDANSPSTVGDLCLAAGYSKAWAPTQYEADREKRNWMQVGTPPHAGAPTPGKGRPSIHMPRWVSRILLEVVAVRVERLNDISAVDAIAEGIRRIGDGFERWHPDPADTAHTGTTKDSMLAYRGLWESINGAASWDANPWVWAITFKRVTP